MQNTHQAELVAQLQQEARQWKGQCLRLEETLRGEIIPSNRRRAHAPSQPVVFTGYAPKRVPIRTVDSSATSSSSTKRVSGSSPTARADKHQCDHRPHSPTPALPPPRLVRRVQAVIEPDDAVLHHTSTPTGGSDMRRRKSSAGSHQSTKFARSDYIDEGEEGPSDEASGGEYADEEEGENVGMGTVTARGRTMPWGRRHIFQQPDEEDDELMMYANSRVLPHPHSPLASPLLTQSDS
ncbi:hypothetical protein BJV78DRAFT_1286456 [Lactifluus subvellereus]|nr:hypothetical protein BJV78DRAFT_1286456 [Lactifluus subvellereus]